MIKNKLFSYSIYNLDGVTLQELLCQICDLLNQCVNDVNKYTEIVNSLVDWIKNEGVENEVREILSIWKDDGTMASLINDVVFNDIKSRINNLEYKDTELQSQITELQTEIHNNRVETTSEINDLKFKDTELQNQVTNLQFEIHNNRVENKSDINDLNYRDGELQGQITSLQNTINSLRGEYLSAPKMKSFRLKNIYPDFVVDSTISNELVSTIRTETYFVNVTYTNPIPSEYMPGTVIGSLLNIGDNKIDVRVSDVSRNGFRFCFIDTTNGNKVTTESMCQSSVATYIEFQHISGTRTDSQYTLETPVTIPLE